MKLSPKQKEVIRLMREGWELCESTFYIGRYWVTRRPDGYSQNIHAATARGLLIHKLVSVSVEVGRPQTHTLTDLGKTIEI